MAVDIDVGGAGRSRWALASREQKRPTMEEDVLLVREQRPSRRPCPTLGREFDSGLRRLECGRPLCTSRGVGEGVADAVCDDEEGVVVDGGSVEGKGEVVEGEDDDGWKRRWTMSVPFEELPVVSHDSDEAPLLVRSPDAHQNAFEGSPYTFLTSIPSSFHHLLPSESTSTSSQLWPSQMPREVADANPASFGVAAIAS